MIFWKAPGQFESPGGQLGGSRQTRCPEDHRTPVLGLVETLMRISQNKFCVCSSLPLSYAKSVELLYTSTLPDRQVNFSLEHRSCF